VDEALERHLLALDELFRQVTIEREVAHAGQLRQRFEAARVGVHPPARDVAGTLDDRGSMREPTDDRLGDERHRQRRVGPEEREPRHGLGHDLALHRPRARLVLAAQHGLRRWARQPATVRDQRGEQRGAVLGSDDTVRRKLLGLREQRLRLDPLELVEVAPKRVDAITLVETSRLDRRKIARRWPDEKDISHAEGW
jgi:hypothetical protein